MLTRYTSNEPSEEIANAKRQKYVSKFGGPPFRLVDGLWRYFARDRTSPGLLVVPSSLQDEVLTLCHDKEHRGVTATLRLVSDRFWWPGYRKAVIEHVLTCISCCRYNRKKLPAVDTLADLGHRRCQVLGNVGGWIRITSGCLVTITINILR
jgi:hypothetical protein